MHSTSGAWKEYSFQRRWRCCCERIWSARESGQANAPVSAMLCTKRGERLRVRWQSIELIFGPAVLDRHVLTLDITGVLEALAKRAQTVRQRVKRPAVEEPDHRHPRLLRARRERPRNRRTAEQ